MKDSPFNKWSTIWFWTVVPCYIAQTVLMPGWPMRAIWLCWTLTLAFAWGPEWIRRWRLSNSILSAAAHGNSVVDLLIANYRDYQQECQALEIQPDMEEFANRMKMLLGQFQAANFGALEEAVAAETGNASS